MITVYYTVNGMVKPFTIILDTNVINNVFTRNHLNQFYSIWVGNDVLVRTTVVPVHVTVLNMVVCLIVENLDIFYIVTIVRDVVNT